MLCETIMQPSDDWPQIHLHILQLEQEGIVTRTFRRLDPERQQAILGAILDEVGEKGPAALNIKDVAARAEVAVGSLYQYFGSRDGMFNFAIELCSRYLVGMLDGYRPYMAEMPLREGLRAYVSDSIAWNQTYASMMQFFAQGAYHGDPQMTACLVQPVAAVIRRTIEDMLTAAAARGEIRADLDIASTARVIYAAMVAISDSKLLPHLNEYFQVYGEDAPFERALETFVELMLGALEQHD
jgi:AcrR family transcriptional regulator